MLRSIFRVETYRRGIVVSSGFNVLAKGLGFLQSIALAFYFGAQAKTDIVFFCISISTLGSSFLALLNSTVIIPEAMRLSEQDSRSHYQYFLNYFLMIYIIIIGIVTISYLANPVGFLLVTSNFDRSLLIEQSHLVVLAAPLFLLMVVNQYFIDILTSQRFFTVPMISNMINSIIVLLAVVLLHRRYDIASMLIGLVSAYSLQCVLLTILLKIQLKWRFRLEYHPIRKLIWHNLAYAQLGNLLAVFTSYLPILIFSGYASGVVTSLNYGQKIADMPTNIITSQFSSVVGVKFNELCAKMNYKDLDNTFRKSINVLSFILLPIALLLFVYSEEIISVIFKRGAFTDESVKISALFLRYLALIIPFMGIVSIGARLFMALQIIKYTFWIQILSNGILLLFLLIAISTWGAIGYPLAFLLVSIINAVITILIIKKFRPEIVAKSIVVSVGKMVLINAVVATVLFLLKDHIHLPVLYKLVVGGIFYAAALLVFNRIMKLEKEIDSMISGWYGKLWSSR